MDRVKGLPQKLKDLMLGCTRMFNERRMSVYSGYATLFIVTAVFPCIILIISIVNLLPGYSTKDVVDIIFQILPALESVRESVVSLMTDIKDESGGLLASAAAVTTLWAASKGTSSIQNGLNQLDDSEKVVEIKKMGMDAMMGILKRLLFTLALVLLIPALLLFRMLGDSLAKTICSAVKKVNPDVLNSTLQKIDSFFNISSVVVILLALLIIMAIYAVLPTKRRTLKSQLPGAVLCGVSWFLFTELFSFFIPRFYHASNLYGSLASLFLILMWLRYMIMILFAGGVLNRVLEEARSRE